MNNTGRSIAASPAGRPAASFHVLRLAALLFFSLPGCLVGAEPKGENASAAKWTSLFDGKTLGKWEVVEKYDFKRHGKVEVKDGSLLLEDGLAATGVRWKGPFPKMNYEVTLEGMRVEGNDFFCGMTFPVGETALTLVLGGWSGDIVGLSDINGDSAVDNETGQAVEFKNGRWYRIRLRVTKSRIEAWLDDDNIVDLATDDLKFTLRWEMEPCLPFGFATWYTTGALRKIRVRTVDSTAEGDGRAKP